MDILTAARCVTRAFLNIDALLHVVQSINAFLDISVLYAIPQAAKSGSLRLFDRVHSRVAVMDAEPGVFLDSMSRAMENAIRKGDLEMVRHIDKHHPGPLSLNVFEVAARVGHLEVLRWLIGHRCDGVCSADPPSKRSSCWTLNFYCCFERVFYSAVQHGHFEVAEWLCRSGYSGLGHLVGEYAVAHGDLDVVKRGDVEMKRINQWYRDEQLIECVRKGYLHVVRFLSEKSDKVWFPLESLDSAVAFGHEELAAYLRQQDIRTELTPSIVVEASRAGRLDLVEQNSYHLDSAATLVEKAMTAAISNGHLQVVQWIWTHCRPSVGEESVLTTMAKNGHLDMLEWLSGQSNVSWTSKVMDDAATYGHLHVVQWLHEHRPEGCTTNAMDGAASGGHLEILRWLQANRTEGFTERGLEAAVSNGHLAVVQWLLHQNTCLLTTDVMETAAWTGKLAVLEYLCGQWTGYIDIEVLDFANGNHRNVFVRLYEHYLDRFDPDEMKRVIGKFVAHPLLIEWLVQKLTV